MWSILNHVTLIIVGVAFTTSLGDTKQNVTVVMALSEPYLMLKEYEGMKKYGVRSMEEYEGLSVWEKYEGFSKDLVLELCKEAKIKVDIRVVDSYGKYDENTGRWTGMIGELIEGTADMAIADLTITEARDKVIDFSVPFMKGGITILYKKPPPCEPNMFFFLTPFSMEVWISIIASYLGMVILYFISKLIKTKGSESDENKIASFSLPILKTTSAIFTIFLVCIYTATLSRAFTLEPEPIPESVEDLAGQNKIKFGMVHSGSTQAFFRESKDHIYEKMWRAMSEKPEVFTKDNKDGVNRVRRDDGNYAFLMESNTAKYVTERKCDLRTIGGLLNKADYGIGFQLESIHRKPINQALLKLESEGTLKRLKIKWWKQKRGGGACANWDGTEREVLTTLELNNIAGLFWFLLFGFIIIIVAIGLEGLWRYYKA